MTAHPHSSARAGGEQLFFELALEDITQAADLFRLTYERTCGVDAMSARSFALLAHDAKATSPQQSI